MTIIGNTIPWGQVISWGLKILPAVGSFIGSAVPVIASLFGKGTEGESSTNTTGGIIGGSSSATSQTGQSATSTIGGGSSTTVNVNQGSTGGLAGLLQAASQTPTGNNSSSAWGLGQLSATTANLLQTGQWALSQALSIWQQNQANKANQEALTSARAYNSNEAKLARDWQQAMRSTAYQDTVKDLQKAGLNPILAASKGATATPTTSSASLGSPGQIAQAAQIMSTPSAHTASAQAMYDYGNNTAQFLNNAMQTINNAKSFGFEKVAHDMYQSMIGVSSASSKQINQYAQMSSQLSDAISESYSHYGKNGGNTSSDSGAHQMGGGSSHGSGAGRGR